MVTLEMKGRELLVQPFIAALGALLVINLRQTYMAARGKLCDL